MLQNEIDKNVDSIAGIGLPCGILHACFNLGERLNLLLLES